MAQNILAIGGIPGTGKTTLMRAFMAQHKYSEAKDFRPLVKGHSCDSHLLLGVYEEGEVFAGTDRWSMAVQPEAEQFFEKNNDDDVVFEGDRIFNKKMFSYIIGLKKYNLFILLLDAEPAILSARYAERGSDQSDKFINGRKTKYENIENDVDLAPYVRKVLHQNQSDTSTIIGYMNQFLSSGVIPDALPAKKIASMDDFFA